MSSQSGRFFEDFSLGKIISHAVPRTLTDGERALYHAIYPSNFALYSSDEFARQCGLNSSPLDPLIVFHTVFGKSVPDISLNAVANLGYAECQWLEAVYPGDTLSARSEVIGLRPTSKGNAGIVWVRTTGINQHGRAVIEFVRWVLIQCRGDGSHVETVVPTLQPQVPPSDLCAPGGLTFSSYNFDQTGERHRWSDYAIGQTVSHSHGTTLTDAEHMIATRLWQNTARVHFDTNARTDGRRLVYGGHVISLARALSFDGLANAQVVVAINAGTHVNPCFSGDTVTAWSEVLDKASSAVPGAGALRLRLVAMKNWNGSFDLAGDAVNHSGDCLLELDYWALIPR